MSLYGSSLETLAAPMQGGRVEDSLKALGDRIVALVPRADDASAGKELTLAVGHLGKLIVDATAKRRALDIAREADPSIRAALLQLADMIGADHGSGGLRTTLWSNWTVRATEIRVAFLAPGADKRRVAARYAEALDGRQTSDSALAALRKAVIDLADLHSAVAQGRTADASAIVAVLRQEVGFAKGLLESARGPRPKDGTP